MAADRRAGTGIQGRLAQGITGLLAQENHRCKAGPHRQPGKLLDALIAPGMIQNDRVKTLRQNLHGRGAALPGVVFDHL
jgi:hypothetical protein